MSRIRISQEQTRAIARLARELTGEQARVRLFGSRLDERARGGDVDLFLELPFPVENPALTAARLSARVSRLFRGRRVDVLIAAPNLKNLPIHEAARRQGVLL